MRDNSDDTILIEENSEDNTPKNTTGFLSKTMNAAESIVSNSSFNPKNYMETLYSLKDHFVKSNQKEEIAPMAKNAPGAFSSHIYLIFGWVLLALSCIFLIARIAIRHASLLNTGLIIILPLLLSFYLLFKGIQKSRYAETFLIYKRAFGDKPYISIKQLSEYSRDSERKVIKRLEQYQRADLYPQGRFCEGDSYYALSAPAEELLKEKLHQQYLQREVQGKERELQEQYPKLYTMTTDITETMDAIQSLKRSKTAADNPELNKQLKRMVRLLGETKKYIINNPQKVPDIGGFLNYFLPTVSKLLGTYYKLDSEPIQTENIITTKAEIESVLESINQAFENLYDDFYTETAIDIYSDVSVLKTMIQKQGLSESDF